MPFIFPYRIFPDGAGGHVYWAVCNVQMAQAGVNTPRTKRFEAIVDSGATRCLFHADFASYIGLDLKRGTPEITNGISGREIIWLHDITLFLPGGPANVRAGFKQNLPVGGLLGMSGFFEHFNITFDSSLRECRLDRIYRA